MEAELELLKRKMLLQMMTPKARSKCPVEPNGDSKKLNEIINKCKVVIVDFWAEWCGPCRLVEPIIERIAEKYKDRISVVKINVDLNPDVAAAYEVMSVPTVLVFHNRDLVRRFIGYSSYLYKNLDELIKKLL